jgi:hypothetical protein
MRVFAVVALASLTFVVAGCGGASSVRSDSASGGPPGSDAVRLVPAGVVAFMAFDTDRSSEQWQRLDQLTSALPARAPFLQKLRAALAQRGLSYDRDVAPAVGNELDLAALNLGGAQPDVIAFARPSDQAKLRALASKFDSGGEHYTVQQIGEWSVVADSDAAFAAVRAASSGRSLAQTAAYGAARARLDGDAIAWYYARGQQASSPLALQWTAAKLELGRNAVRASAVAAGNIVPAPAVPKLLRDVPAESAFAASFESGAALTTALRTAKLPSVPLTQLAPLLDGGGVAYVRPKGIFPEVAVELTPAHPEQALARARRLLRSNSSRFGPLRLTAELAAGRLVISDSPAAASALRGGAKLVDEAAFKDALATAGAPARTSALVYANVSQLAPFLQLAAAGSGKPVDPALGDTLGDVGGLVAWTTRSNGISRFELRAARR